MGKAKGGNKRLMITLPVSLIDRLESDTHERGLDLTKSARIQLALERDLNQSTISSDDTVNLTDQNDTDNNNDNVLRKDINL